MGTTRLVLAATLAALLAPAPLLAAAQDGGPAPAPAPAAPQEPEEGKEPPAPAPDAPPPIPIPQVRTLRLALREAVAMALRNNLDLQADSYGPAIAAATVREAESLYSHLFTARVNGGQIHTPSSIDVKGDGTEISGDASSTAEDRLVASAGLQRLLPSGGTISLDAVADRTYTNNYLYDNPAFASFNPYYETRVGLNLRQPLLRGFGREVTESGIRATRNSQDIAELELRGRTEALVRDVEVAYWLLVGLRGDVEAQFKSVAVAEDLVRITEARLAAGAGTRVDVSQASAGLAQRRVDLLRAENRLRAEEERILGLLLSRTTESPTGERLRFDASEDPYRSLPAVPKEDIEAAVAHALGARTDLRQQRIIVDQAQVSVLRSESEALMRLDLLANVTYNGVDGNLGQSYSESLASREFATWNVGFLIEIPIGNRAARARLDRSILFRSQSEAQVRALESDAAVRVRNSRRDLESTREQIDAAIRATALAEEQLAAEKERLANDKSTTFQVLELEADLTEARRSELRALVDYLTASTRYDYEVGRILETRGLAPPPTAERER